MTNGCTFDPATVLLGIYPTNQLTDLQNDKKTRLITAALVMRAKY